MRLAPFLASTFIVAVVVVACADSDDSNGTPILDSGVADAKAKDGGSSSGSTSSSGAACTKKTCESVEGACGDHDDGCGGTFSCGKCKDDDACAPKTCTALGKTCGVFDDQCGGQVNCGACATTCPKDAKEPNDKPEGATDLGKASDSDDATITVTALQSSDGDEDWFKIAVTDAGFTGNPLITATITDTALEVAIFHVCASQPDYSYCEGAGTQEDTIGHGCYALGTVKLNTDCKGLDESGTTYVRVRKRGVDATCHAYDLAVKVE
jgi:hypothetical protein